MLGQRQRQKRRRGRPINSNYRRVSVQVVRRTTGTCHNLPQRRGCGQVPWEVVASCRQTTGRDDDSYHWCMVERRSQPSRRRGVFCVIVTACDQSTAALTHSNRLLNGHHAPLSLCLNSPPRRMTGGRVRCDTGCNTLYQTMPLTRKFQEYNP